MFVTVESTVVVGVKCAVTLIRFLGKWTENIISFHEPPAVSYLKVDDDFRNILSLPD